MNKFRANLHPAFFGALDDMGQKIKSSFEKIKDTTKEAISKVEESVRNGAVDVARFVDNLPGDIVNEQERRYGNESLYISDRKRFTTRIRDNAKDWSQRIKDGYNHLIQALQDGYLKNSDENTKKQVIENAKSKYMEEIKRQYRKKVWDAGDKNFDKVKWTLFGKDSEDYPANNVYKEITGAVTIFVNDGPDNSGWGSYVLNSPEDLADWETISERRNRNFLANDLTKYLWGIRKAPWVAFDVIQWIIPIFSAKIERPSKEDRKAIDSFLRIARELDFQQWKYEDWAMALLDVFHDNNIKENFSADTFEKALASKGITVKKSKLDDVMEAFRFYRQTRWERKEVQDQHAIYLSILGIIETSWWAQKARMKYEKIVEDAKKDKKTEKKQWYQKWEVLDKTEEGKKLKALATKLWTLDFTNASRLLSIDEKQSDYFNNTPVDQILANLSNDRTIDARDVTAWWLKSWPQFLRIFNQVGKDTALSSLWAHAKLLNTTLSLGLHDSVFDNIEGEIRKWNKELILLLQNIISKPGEDLYTLLSGHKDSSAERADLKGAYEKAEQFMTNQAEPLINALHDAGIDTSGVNLSNAAAVLYSEYRKWLWVWSTVSFDEWVKWVSFTTWVQFRDDGKAVVWLSLNYKKDVNLWNGWSMTPWLSAWMFMPLWYWDSGLNGSVSLTDEVAKEWLTKKWIIRKAWVDGGVSLVSGGIVVVSVWLKWEQDKFSWIELREQQLRWEMETKMLATLERIKNGLWTDTKLDLTKPEVRSVVENELKNMAEQNGVKQKDIKDVVNATMRLLTNYQNWDLSNQWERSLIAQLVADQYAMAWAEGRKSQLFKKGFDLSSAGLGVFWAAWTPLVWVYIWAEMKKSQSDGYGDRWWAWYTIDQEPASGRDQNSIEKFNKDAWLLEPWEKLEMKTVGDGADAKQYVRIPKSIAHSVNVNEKLKWNMKIDENWDVLLHVQTPMAAKLQTWTATRSRELIIGWKWKKWEDNFIKLDVALSDNNKKDRFTDGDIKETEVLNLWEEVEYTPELMKQALEELKKKSKLVETQVGTLALDEVTLATLCEKAKELKEKEPTHKVKLIVSKDANVLKAEVQDSWEWKWLDIEYKADLEMFNDNAKKIAERVYGEALKLKNPQHLWSVKHKENGQGKKKWWQEYQIFENAMESGDYAVARTQIDKIFKTLDRLYGGKTSFNDISGELTKIDAKTDSVALGQALMSIRNVFARGQTVDWWSDTKYHFDRDRKKHWMSGIIERREDQIGWTIRDSNIDGEYRDAYLELIDASKKYRKENPSLFEVTEATAAKQGNTIWFNLWDQRNPENPLLNPEIYEAQMIPFDKLVENWLSEDNKNRLYKRAMLKFWEDKVLRAPILEKLGIQDNWKVDVKFENWKLILDNWEKKVTINADMSFGYFTQCVNHTIILSNINAVTEDGTTLILRSIHEGVHNTEGSIYQNESSIRVWATIAFNGSRKSKKNWGWADTELWWGGGEWTWEDGDSHLENNHNYNYH